jgi:hypothetical protein
MGDVDMMDSSEFPGCRLETAGPSRALTYTRIATTTISLKPRAAGSFRHLTGFLSHVLLLSARMNFCCRTSPQSYWYALPLSLIRHPPEPVPAKLVRALQPTQLVMF